MIAEQTKTKTLIERLNEVHVWEDPDQLDPLGCIVWHLRYGPFEL